MKRKINKLTFLSIMITFNFIFTSIFRIEGMAPISSVMNILAGIIMGPLYAFYMAFITGLLRIFILGSPPFALLGPFLVAYWQVFYSKLIIKTI